MSSPPPPPQLPSRANANGLVGGGSGGTEGARGLVCGLLFGLTSPLVGHPLDSIKTRMQADAAYSKCGALRTLVGVVRTEGVLALYRGIVPPLVGSSVFRSVQISTFAGVYAAAGGTALAAELPGTGGLQARVLVAAVVSSTARALIETPLELIKVRQQTSQRWLLAGGASPAAQLRALYLGFGVTWSRTVGLMSTFFVLADSLERHAPALVAVPLLGPFLKGGVCATLGWVVIWPFEFIKNHLQARAAGVAADAGVFARARHIVAERGGLLGLYRGIGPGLLRSLLANGASMVVYDQCQRALRAAD